MALAMAAAGLGLAEPLFGFRATEREVLALSMRRVDAALRHNNRSDMAYATRAGLLMFPEGRLTEALAAADRALEINADYNMGFWMRGLAVLLGSDWDGAATAGERAVRIDPDDPYVHLYGRVAGLAHLGAGRLDRALNWLYRCDQLAPGVAQNLAGLAIAHGRAGDAAAARRDAIRLMDAEPDLRLSRACPIPFRQPAEWQRYAQELRKAGVPD